MPQTPEPQPEIIDLCLRTVVVLFFLACIAMIIWGD